MRIRSFSVFVVFLLVATIATWEPARAEEKRGHSAPKESLQGVWTQVLKSHDEMGRLIAAKKLGDVENPAFQIAGLVTRLPGLSEMLPADWMASLKQFIKDVQKLASDLDNTGDSNNLPGTQANAKKLDDVLKSIAELYPKGTLPERPAANNAPATGTQSQQPKLTERGQG